jgi:hypothetical protein
MSVAKGVPLAVYYTDSFPVGDTPEEQARDYLRENESLFRLRNGDLADLVHHATRSTSAADTVRLRQTYDRVPVMGAEITVTINSSGRVSFVANTYEPDVFVATTTPRIEQADARTKALAALAPQGVAWERGELLIDPRGGTDRLAWRIWFEPSVTPIGSWQVYVDATTGEVYDAVDKAHYADGSADVFDPDPLMRNRATYGDPGYVDGGDADTPQLDAARLAVILFDITYAVGTNTYSLVGPRAEIRDSESPFLGLFQQVGDDDWDFTRSPSDFEAANVYNQIDRQMAYLNDTLGLAITPYQYVGGVRFDPHGLSGADNSHYNSGSGEVAFGEGCVDDSEDADVIIHELGHGLHDWVTNGGLSQINGLSEGIGDFQAASYARALNEANTPNFWTPADPAYHWVFKWDGHNVCWNGRITNYGAIYPGGLTGQIHTDGQIWSTCMMKAWDLLGRDAIERAHWTGMGRTNSGTNQQDAAQAVLIAAADLGYPYQDVLDLETSLETCGYVLTTPALDIPFFADGFESGDTSAWSVTQG